MYLLKNYLGENDQSIKMRIALDNLRKSMGILSVKSSQNSRSSMSLGSSMESIKEMSESEDSKND